MLESGLLSQSISLLSLLNTKREIELYAQLATVLWKICVKKSENLEEHYWFLNKQCFN